MPRKLKLVKRRTTQPPIFDNKGRRLRRLPAFTCMHPDIKELFEREAAATGRSVSWCIIDAAGRAIGVDLLTGELLGRRKRA
jgi:hypothetical protein